MSPTWFGLSHGRAWGDVGHSFADLTSCEGCQKRGLPTQQSAVSAAGFRSKPKGAGSFQLQVGVYMLRLSVSGRRLNLLVVFRPSGVWHRPLEQLATIQKLLTATSNLPEALDLRYVLNITLCHHRRLFAKGWCYLRFHKLPEGRAQASPKRHTL